MIIELQRHGELSKTLEHTETNKDNAAENEGGAGAAGVTIAEAVDNYVASRGALRLRRGMLSYKTR